MLCRGAQLFTTTTMDTLSKLLMGLNLECDELFDTA